MYDCIIIGAGPSGLAASMRLKGKKVLIIEKNNTAGKKLLITGGGRCNVTNLKDNNRFLNEVDYNKKYLYSTINNFGPTDIYDFFIKNGVKLKKEDDDKIFPLSNNSNDILNALLENSQTINCKEEVLNIVINNNYKEVVTNKGKYKAQNIVVATGGSSFKNTGSTGDNLKFAKMINQPVVDIFPAETKIITIDKFDLAGISFNNVNVVAGKIKKSGNFIFTHNGISGSAIMKISEFIYKNSDKEIKVDFIPMKSAEKIEDMFYEFDKNKELISFFNILFPKRFSEYLINKLNFNHRKIKTISEKDIKYISSYLKGFEIKIKGVGSIEESYVTGGGIDLNFINTKTMESKINEGIYFVGEALDIHGPIGGYNITLALSTGYSAGDDILRKLSLTKFDKNGK